MIQKIMWFSIAVLYIVGLYHMFFGVELYGYLSFVIALVIAHIGVVTSINKSLTIIRSIRADIQDMRDYINRK